MTATSASDGAGHAGEPPVTCLVSGGSVGARVLPFAALGVLSIAALADWAACAPPPCFATTLVDGPIAKGAAFGGMVGIRLLPALVLGPSRA